MANPFFSAFLPMATQSAAHGLIGTGQGMIEGQQLFQQLAAQQIQNEQMQQQLEQQRQLFPLQMQTQQAMLSQLPQLNQLELQGKQQDIASKRASQGLSEAQAKMYSGGMYLPGNIDEQMNRWLVPDPNDPDGMAKQAKAHAYFAEKAKAKMGGALGAGHAPLDDYTLLEMAHEATLTGKEPTFHGPFGQINEQRYKTLRADPNAQLPPNPYQPPQTMPPSAKGQPMPKASNRAQDIVQQQGQTKLMREGVSEFGPKGKAGASVRSFDVAIEHLETLRRLAKAMSANNTQEVNKWSNFLSKQLGKPEVTNYQTAQKIVADEVTKAIVGGGAAMSDRDKNEAALLASGSPEQIQGAIDTLMELMRGQLKGLRLSYESSTGRRDFDKMLTENAKTKTLEKMMGNAPKAMPVPSKTETTNQEMNTARERLRGKDKAYLDKVLKNPNLTKDQRTLIEEAWMMEQGQR